MGRPKDWKPPVGTAAVTLIGPAIRLSAEIFGIGGLSYESRDFRTGVDVDKMQLVASTVEKLFDLGLHFDQQDIEDGIKSEVHSNELYKAAVRNQAATKGKSETELLFDQAYGLRTILAHANLRHKQHEKFVQSKATDKRLCEKTHPAWLRSIYLVIFEQATGFFLCLRLLVFLVHYSVCSNIC